MKKIILSFIFIISTIFSYSQNLEILNHINDIRAKNNKKILFLDDVLCNVSKDYSSYVLSHYNHIPVKKIDKKIQNIFYDTEYEYQKMLFERGLSEEEIYNFGFFIGSYSEKYKSKDDWVNYFKEDLNHGYFLDFIANSDLKIAGISIINQKSLGKYTQVCIIMVTLQ
jgi:hypothetical protein